MRYVLILLILWMGVPVRAQPAPPTILEPVNGSTTQDTAPHFRWTAVEDAASYDLSVTGSDVRNVTITDLAFACAEGVCSYHFSTPFPLGTYSVTVSEIGAGSSVPVTFSVTGSTSIPTPTPRPDPNPDDLTDFNIDADGFVQNVSYEAVQFWNMGEEQGFTVLIQWFLIVLLVIAGLYAALR